MTAQSPKDELFAKIWQEQIKSWIDFRQFLHQRRIGLMHPNLDFPEGEKKSPHWKSHLGFALQENQLWQAELIPKIEEAYSALSKLAIPAALVLAAYVFRVLTRIGLSGNGDSLRNEAHVVYLYYVTGSLFWINLLLAALLAF